MQLPKHSVKLIFPYFYFQSRVLCDECDNYFHDRSTMNRHKKKIHGVESPIIIKTKASERIVSTIANAYFEFIVG